MENKSRVYWIVGAIAAGGVVLSMILGAVAGGAAGYLVGRRTARAGLPSLDSGVIRPFTQQPRTQPTPQPRVQPPTDVQVAAELTSVVADAPAAQAGLKVGDLIVAVGKTNITMTADLTQLIRQYKPGDTASIRYVRDGTTRTVQVKLGARPENADAPYLGVEYRMNLQAGGGTTPR